MKKNSEILLSIICPIYNGEKVVGNLIESLENQEYKDYELVLVNDGSEDNTLKVLNEYSKKYPNIIVVDKPHTGLCDTRNAGVEHSHGKYLTIGDCDDYYSADFFEKIIPIIQEGGFELLIFNAYVMNYDKFMHYLIPDKYKSGYFEEKNGVYKYLRGQFGHQIANNTWNKIYPREVIDKYKFKYSVENHGEDLLYHILYTSKITKYRYFNEKLYYYQLNMNPLTTNSYRENEVKDVLDYYEPIKKICVNSQLEKWEEYLSLFFLRRLPIIVLNETNCDDYNKGKENIESFLNNKIILSLFKKIKFKYFDFKLFISFLLYKLKLYKLVYIVLWKKRHKKRNH